MRLAVVVLLALNAIVLAAGLRGALPLPVSAPLGVDLTPAHTQPPGPRLDLLREIAPDAVSAASVTPEAHLSPADSGAPPLREPSLPVVPSPEVTAPPPTPSAPDPVSTDARPADRLPLPSSNGPAESPTLGSSPAGAFAPPAPTATVAAAQEAQPARCLMVGPAGTVAGKTLRDLTAVLKQAGAADITAVDQRTGPVRHWVVLPGFASTDQARAALARLADAGIADTAILPDGDAGYLVSLGVFAQPAGAQRHAATVRAAGFEAQLRQRATGPARQWVRATLPGAVADKLRLPTGVRAAPCAADSG